jgi:CubicO group peptidase (beta-lactamase class C family)
MKTFLLLIYLLWTCTSIAQTSETQKIEAYMQGQYEINQFSGTVLVTRKGNILLHKAYGLADMEWSVPNSINTKFGLASVTKQVTAIGVLQLVERGKLSLEHTLNKFFPGFPHGDSVTIHMLLTHTSGLALDFEELYLENASISKDSAISYIKKLPFQFAPGTKVAYSNVGYFLLSAIIEQASGVTFGEYLKQNIFDVAGMEHSGLCSNEKLVQGLARSYCREEDGFVKNPYINWNLNVGLDGMYATANDLYKLDRALNGNTLLSESSKAKMFTQYNKALADDGFIDSYGVFINPYFNHGHYMLTHSGGYFGVMTTMDRYPADDVFITVLSNNQAESHWIGYGLAAIVFGKDVQVPYRRTVASIDTKLLRKYTGKYGKLDILERDGKLYMNNFETELLPESNLKFYIANNQDRGLEFLPGKKNSISLITTKGGVRDTLSRSIPLPGKKPR